MKTVSGQIGIFGIRFEKESQAEFNKTDVAGLRFKYGRKLEINQDAKEENGAPRRCYSLDGVKSFPADTLVHWNSGANGHFNFLKQDGKFDILEFEVEVPELNTNFEDSASVVDLDKDKL